jgi:deazaflavin-dependent oxidoreductase (nitroreductase family)
MFLFKLFMALHVAIYRLTGGKIGGRMGRGQVLLLTTTGRKSGKVRTVPLGRFDRKGGYLIVGSMGGAPTDPGWIFNLRSQPHVNVQILDKIIPVTAEFLTGEERAQAWQQVITEAPSYAAYEKRTTREIPLVLLHPDQ